MSGFGPTASAPTAAIPEGIFEADREDPRGFTNRAEGAAFNVDGDGDRPAFIVRGGTILEFRRSLSQIGGFAGDATPDFGAIVLPNLDGALDDLVDHAIDGRRVVVKLGGTGFAYDEFGTIYDATASPFVFERDALRIPLRNLSFLLDKPLQDSVYAGTGTYEGGDDLTGRVKPVTYGRCLEVPLVLVDPAYLLYQFHDGQAQSVDAVYDRGVALTGAGDVADLYGASVSAGTYKTDLARGLVRLGSSPAGRITADVRGSKTGGVYVNTTGAILRRMASERGGVRDPAGIDVAGFARLETDAPAEVGLHIGNAANLAQTLAEFAAGAGAFQGYTRLGFYTAGILTAPSGSPVDSFDDSNILSIEKLALPEPIALPWWRVRVGWQRLWSGAQTDDLAGGVSDSRRAFLATEYRNAAAVNMSARARHVMAVDAAPVRGFYHAESDAQAEATRLATLYGTDRALYRVKVNAQPFLLDLTNVVRLTHARYGLSGGRDFRIVKLFEQVRATGASVEMEVFG